MTVSLFKITPTPPTTLKLEIGQQGTFSFTVESLVAPDTVQEVVVQALLVNDHGEGKEVSWLVVGPQRILSLPGGKTQTITVTTKPTDASPRGDNVIKLLVADKERPNDLFTDSAPVTCEVLASLVAATDPPPRRWPLLAIGAGGALVLVGVALLIVKLAGGTSSRPGLGEACSGDAADACDTGLVCVAAVHKCLLVAGAACNPSQAGSCASGECGAATKVCAVPLGSACDPAAGPPCATNSSCDPATRTCLAVAPCASNPPGLGGRWRGEMNANDETEAHHGVPTSNRVGYAPGKHGMAFSLDGTSAIAIDDRETLWPAASFSLEAWIRTTSGGAIITKYQCGGLCPSGQSRAYWALWVGKTGTAAFHSRTDALDQIATVTDTLHDVHDGQWHHIVGVRDVANRTMSSYVDGTLAVSSNLQPGELGAMSDLDHEVDRVVIGGEEGAGGVGSFFTGAIDEVSYYASALTASQVAAIYAARDGECH